MVLLVPLAELFGRFAWLSFAKNMLWVEVENER